MSIATQRGNSNLMKQLQKGAKQVSDHNPIVQSLSFDAPTTPVVVSEAGAAASLRKMSSGPVQSTPGAAQVHISHRQTKPIVENFSEKAFVTHLLESVSTLGSTKEYFNAVNSMFTLYAMGQLTEGVLDSLSRGDLREIKGIVKEFSDILNSY